MEPTAPSEEPAQVAELMPVTEPQPTALRESADEKPVSAQDVELAPAEEDEEIDVAEVLEPEIALEGEIVEDELEPAATAPEPWEMPSTEPAKESVQELAAPEPAKESAQEVATPEPEIPIEELAAPEPVELTAEEVATPEPAPEPVQKLAEPEPAEIPVEELAAPEPVELTAEEVATPEPAPEPVQKLDAPEPAKEPVQKLSPLDPAEISVEEVSTPEPAKKPVQQLDALEPAEIPVEEVAAREPIELTAEEVATPESVKKPDQQPASLEPAEISAEEVAAPEPAEIPVEKVATPEPAEAPARDANLESGVWAVESLPAPEAVAEEKPRLPVDLGELPPMPEEPMQLAATWEFMSMAEAHAGSSAMPVSADRGIELDTPVPPVIEHTGSTDDEVALAPTMDFVPQWKPESEPPKVEAAPASPETRVEVTTTGKYGIGLQEHTTTGKYGIGPASQPAAVQAGESEPGSDQSFPADVPASAPSKAPEAPAVAPAEAEEPDPFMEFAAEEERKRAAAAAAPAPDAGPGSQGSSGT